MIEAGVRTVKCRECGVVGTLRVRSSSSQAAGKAVHVEDSIPHAEGCSLHTREQPRHLHRRRDWQKQEKRANALVGARATIASGALNEDGDGRVFGEWRVESKQTKWPVFVLSQAVWSKLVEGAMRAGEEPLLHVQMDSASRVVVRESWFQQQRGADLLGTPYCDTGAGRRTAKLAVISMPTPYLVRLEPPGVMLYEAEFQKMRERV